MDNKCKFDPNVSHCTRTLMLWRTLDNSSDGISCSSSKVHCSWYSCAATLSAYDDEFRALRKHCFIFASGHTAADVHSLAMGLHCKEGGGGEARNVESQSNQPSDFSFAQNVRQGTWSINFRGRESAREQGQTWSSLTLQTPAEQTRIEYSESATRFEI